MCTCWYIHLLCYIYILAGTWSNIYLHNVEFDESTRLSGSWLFGHAGCGEINNNVNTSWYQDWIRQVCGIIVINNEILVIFNVYFQTLEIILK